LGMCGDCWASLESSVRPSSALYNTCADIDALISASLRITGERRHF